MAAKEFDADHKGQMVKQLDLRQDHLTPVQQLRPENLEDVQCSGSVVLHLFQVQTARTMANQVHWLG